jgi:hypothetical protein
MEGKRRSEEERKKGSGLKVGNNEKWVGTEEERGFGGRAKDDSAGSAQGKVGGDRKRPRLYELHSKLQARRKSKSQDPAAPTWTPLQSALDGLSQSHDNPSSTPTTKASISRY